ncbi:ZIP family metal transporter [Chitinibacteraceae bacterium HSL-7]
MSTLAWIVTASLAGSFLSVLAAALLAYMAKPTWVPKLVSFAVGAMLAAVFIEILPHAFNSHEHHHAAASALIEGASALVDEHAHEVDGAMISLTVMGGILLFFILEKLVIWRHCHQDECEAHDGHAHQDHHGHGHGHGTKSHAGTMILIGDTFHNFVDGAIIAAAFMADTSVGIATAMAIIAHEIPQEVGDFVVLLHSGFSKARALGYNLLSSMAALAGGLLAYCSLKLVNELQPYLLALGAASLLYVAISDLIPGLHRRTRPRDSIEQVVLIAAGIAAILIPHLLWPH